MYVRSSSNKSTNRGELDMYSAELERQKKLCRKFEWTIQFSQAALPRLQRCCLFLLYGVVSFFCFLPSIWKYK